MPDVRRGVHVVDRRGDVVRLHHRRFYGRPSSRPPPPASANSPSATSTARRAPPCSSVEASPLWLLRHRRPPRRFAARAAAGTGRARTVRCPRRRRPAPTAHRRGNSVEQEQLLRTATDRPATRPGCARGGSGAPEPMMLPRRPLDPGRTPSLAAASPRGRRSETAVERHARRPRRPASADVPGADASLTARPPARPAGDAPRLRPSLGGRSGGRLRHDVAAVEMPGAGAEPARTSDGARLRPPATPAVRLRRVPRRRAAPVATAAGDRRARPEQSPAQGSRHPASAAAADGEPERVRGDGRRAGGGAGVRCRRTRRGAARAGRRTPPPARRPARPGGPSVPDAPGSPLQPIVAIGAPSSTASPFATPTEPR